MAKGAPMEFNNLSVVLTSELADIYDAEHQLIECLSGITRAVSNPFLRSVLNEHLYETRTQVDRLERMFSLLGRTPASELCVAMTVILAGADSLSTAPGDVLVKDAVLIGALQRAKHYEIAAYTTARAFAEQLALDDIADLLQESLDEEAAVARRLTRIVEGRIFSNGLNTKASKVEEPRVAY